MHSVLVDWTNNAQYEEGTSIKRSEVIHKPGLDRNGQ